MANENECNTTYDVTGTNPNCQADNTSLVQKFVTLYDFQFDTEADAKDQSKWTDAIIAEELFPLPFIQEADDTSTEVGTWESPVNGNKIYTSEGKTAKKDRIQYDPCLHPRLRSFNNKKVRIIELDKNGNIKMTSPDGTIRKGFAVSDFFVEKYIDAPDKDTIAFTPINIEYSSTAEREDQGVQFKVDWTLLGQNGVIPAKLVESGTSSATTITVNLSYACSGIALSGFTTGSEFIYLQADGVTEEAITVVAEDANVPGLYTLTGAAFVTGGTLNIRNVQTIVNEYYKGTAITITF